MYGFGQPGQGFYHIQVHDKKIKKSKEEFGGIFAVKEGWPIRHWLRQS
jgi:hypothetical protein